MRYLTAFPVFTLLILLDAVFAVLLLPALISEPDWPFSPKFAERVWK